MAEYSTDLAGALERYFGMNGTPHTFDETAGIFRLSVPVEGKLRRIETKILCTEKAIMSSTSLPVAAVPEAMEQTASLLMRLDNVLNFGGFVLDMDTGEVRFRYGVDCHGQLPSYDVIDHMITLPAYVIGIYGDALVSVMLGYATAEDVLADM